MIPLLAALGWIVGAFATGLYLGERGRRQAAERMLTFGSPEASPGAPTSLAPSKEAEDRFLEEAALYSEETVEKLKDHLREEATRQGIEGISDRQLEADARAMLAGMSVEG